MRVLVTAIGGDLGQAVARCCRRHGFEVVGTDQETLQAWAVGPFTDAWFHRVPPAFDPLYKEAIQSILEARGVSLVIPASEPEIKFLARHAEIPSLVTMPAVERRRLDDKYAMFLRLKALGFDENLPETWLPKPLAVKPRRGSGGRGFQKIELTDPEQACVVQEFLTGPEYTVAVWRSKTGETRAMAMNRELRGGATYRMWSRPEQVQTQGAARLGQAIAERTEVVGSINVQLRWTAEGPKIFEINPRFSSTASMRDSLGFCDVLWSIQEALGQPVAAWAGPQTGRSVRYWEERTQVNGEWR